MAQVTASELADRLGVSRARVSQYVSEGKLAGCYRGDGRGRRFDLAACADALGKRLDQAQMLGNGAATRRALADLAGDEADVPAPPDRQKPDVLRDGAMLPARDLDRYEMARTLQAEETARRLRRQNLAEEGTWVLASEVELRVARLIGQEVAQFEAAIRTAASAVAAKLGVDSKLLRHALLDAWRAHRSERAAALAAQADAAGLSETEAEADR